MKKQFRLGDIVEVAENYSSSTLVISDLRNKLGIVVETSNQWGSIGIEIFIAFPEGHDCDGRAKKFHGWRFPPDKLKILFRPSLQSRSKPCKAGK